VRNIASERFDIGASAAVDPRQKTIRHLVVALDGLMICAAAWVAT